MSAATPSQLPAVLAGNPRLDRWVGFLAPGRVRSPSMRTELLLMMRSMLPTRRILLFVRWIDGATRSVCSLSP